MQFAPPLRLRLLPLLKQRRPSLLPVPGVPITQATRNTALRPTRPVHREKNDNRFLAMVRAHKLGHLAPLRRPNRQLQLRFQRLAERALRIHSRRPRNPLQAAQHILLPPRPARPSKSTRMSLQPQPSVPHSKFRQVHTKARLRSSMPPHHPSCVH